MVLKSNASIIYEVTLDVMSCDTMDIDTEEESTKMSWDFALVYCLHFRSNGLMFPKIDTEYPQKWSSVSKQQLYTCTEWFWRRYRRE